MKVLLTGANGYIGRRLLPVLLEAGNEVICCVRDKTRLSHPKHKNLHIFEADFLEGIDINTAPLDFDIAFFLIHSMGSSLRGFETLEKRTALNFKTYIEHSTAQQVIFLSGISNAENLSKHLTSRLQVESYLKSDKYALTILRAGIIVGSGSASFEIIRDLVEKLPVMIAPRWLNTLSQPIAIRDVIKYLMGVMLHPECMNQIFDIGGADVLSYKQMLLDFAKVRKLRRWIFTLPVMTPRLSSYWLFMVTSTSYKLAVNLVDSMHAEVVARDNKLSKLLEIKPIAYKTAVQLAFQRIEQNMVISSWKDSLVSSTKHNTLADYVEVPTYGCFKDHRSRKLEHPQEDVIKNIWSIGGEKGWYYGNFLWKIRGVMDKMVGGVGLRRGRTNSDQINAGDALDFWRVLLAEKNKGRLLLYAEMKLPGEAWLEFKLTKKNELTFITQTATFRPNGLWGRAYWYLVLPFHFFIFEGMLKNIERSYPSYS
ncbi:SDR family oxidoreductase [Flammeovirgaceae bacterium SG7u.111]|nr:SDR family oxidoreductase [Flammeovirgaceae bacterium SG7u.132]WPO36638.1 SDR family oxidoreductase [Flammeovirgaceae bacterium SG7u.111]